MILQIKKKWFDMILSGRKKEEYREIKPYYEIRFSKWFKDGECIITFKNGYSKNAPCFAATCQLKKGYGKEEWGAAPGKEYFVLKIIKIQK